MPSLWWTIRGYNPKMLLTWACIMRRISNRQFLLLFNSPYLIEIHSLMEKVYDNAVCLNILIVNRQTLLAAKTVNNSFVIYKDRSFFTNFSATFTLKCVLNRMCDCGHTIVVSLPPGDSPVYDNTWDRDIFLNFQPHNP